MHHEFDHAIELVDAYLHEALLPDDAAWVEQHCETCPVCKVALDEARRRQAALASLSPSEASEQLVQATLKNIHTRDQERQRWRRVVFWRVGPAVAAVLLLLIGANLHYGLMKPTPYDLVVLGQNQFLVAGNNALRIRLIDHNTGAAVAGVPVEVQLCRQGNGGPVLVDKLASFTTDADGTGQPRFTLPESATGAFVLRVVAHVPGSTEVIDQSITVKRSAKLMLSSDKPLYQPGQVIHLRSLALRQPDLKPVAGEEVTFTIADPRGNLIFKQKGKSSDYGIAAADCPLATEILEGPYAIACKVGDTESKRTVTVQKYVLPKFKVEIAGLQDYYAPGDMIRGRVQADYFFGEPVVGGEVKLTLVGRGMPPLAQLEKTDADGKSAFEIKLPAQLSGDARFTLEAVVTDKAGQKHGKLESRVVTSRPLRIEVIPEAGTLVQNVPNKIFLFASYADGGPAAATIRIGGIDQPLHTGKLGVTSFEVTPANAMLPLSIQVSDADARTARHDVQLYCGQFSQDFLVRTDRAVYDGGQTVQLTALGGGSEPVFVDFIKDGQTVLTETVPMREGRGEYKFDLPPDLFGTIEMNAYRFPPTQKQSYGLILPVRRTRVLYVRPVKQVTLSADVRKEPYHPREEAKVRFRLTDAEGKPAPGALSLAVVDEALFSVLDRAPGMERTFYLLEQELLRPVTNAYPRWTPDAQAKNAERGQLEEAHFARTAKIVPGSRALFDGADGHYITLRSGPADLNPSPVSLLGSSFIEKEVRTYPIRESGLKWVLTAWGILAGTAVLAGYVLAWWYFARGSMLAITLCLVFPLGCSGLLLLTKARSGADIARDEDDVAMFGVPFAAAPEEVTTEDSRNADIAHAEGMRKPAPARAGGGEPRGPEAAEPPIRVRDWFPETLFWQAQQITDDRGEYELPLQLADSITRWRLTASAVTADGRLGAAQADLRVMQDFFVDLDLPVALTRNDEVELRVVVHDHRKKADAPQTVTLTLTDADWFALLDPQAKKTVELMPGEVRAVTYRLAARKVGTHKLEVKARAGSLSDGIRRDIEVIPDGQRVDFVRSGNLEKPAEFALTVPANAIEGSPKAILKIYPSSFSQVVEGLDSIFQMPHGCFEQTSSTTYPNILALDYLRRTKKAVPGVEAKAKGYINAGYQRLLSFEVSRGGGFSLFGRGRGSPILSAYGVMEFRDMAAVHDIDPDLVPRTRTWLLSERRPDGSWEADGVINDLARLRTTAYIAWAIFPGEPKLDANGRTKDYLLQHKPDSIRDPYVLALVCNALLALDPQGDSATPYLNRLEVLRTDEGDKLVFWKQPPEGRTVFYGGGECGDIETTALASLALMTAKRSPATTRGALAWLVGHKDPRGTWHSTQATLLALKALVAATDQPLGDPNRRILVSLGAEELKPIDIPADQGEVIVLRELPIGPGSEVALRIEETSGTAAGYQVALRYHLPAAPADAQEPLAVRVEYDRTEVSVRDSIRATATVSNRLKERSPMVMVELPVPAGFALDPAGLADMVEKGKIARYEVDARKATIYTLGLDGSESLMLSYLLQARQPVKVTAAAPRVYEYYDPARQGRGQAVELSVTPRR